MEWVFLWMEFPNIEIISLLNWQITVNYVYIAYQRNVLMTPYAYN